MPTYLYKCNECEIKFDNAYKRAGACFYQKKTLSFSIRFLRQASADEIRDTLLHEIAHALVGPKNGHNLIWKKKAIELGCSGEIYQRNSFSTPRWIKFCSKKCWEQNCYRRKKNLICKICKSKVLYKNYTSSNSTKVPDISFG